MSCNCNNSNSCNQPTPCSSPNCACPVLISSDCVNNVKEDLVCSNILKGQTLTEVLVQLDAYICTKFDSLSNFLTLLNVGGGAEVYKGTTSLGKKELRTLVGAGAITIVENENDITITINEDALEGTPSAPYVVGWQLERQKGSIITSGKGVGKLLLTNGSNAIIGTGGVNFNDNTTMDSPFDYAEATIILPDGTIRYVQVTSKIDSTHCSIGTVYTDNQYSNSIGSLWDKPTGEYEYYPYFIASVDNDISHAEGYGSQANGFSSHAEGNNTHANGAHCHAEGHNTTAVGNNSHAEGFITTAQGQSSHAEGQSTTAQGNNSHAEGLQTQANGSSSHSEGFNTQANGDFSHSEGLSSIGLGFASHSEGSDTRANGDSAHAEGGGTTAGGDKSHAQGYQTQANGSISHAEGNATIANGFGSHAEGNATTAGGDYSHAEGNLSIASGNNSHAGGDTTTASGLNSFVHGANSTASNTNTIVLGANITGTDANRTYVDKLNIKNVPAGTSVNGLGVDVSGNVVATTSATPYKVYTALVSQVGTSAPTSIILQNTLGATLTWSYVLPGLYTLTASSTVFTTDKTIVFTTRSTPGVGFGWVFSGDNSTTTICNFSVQNASTSGGDDRLSKAALEIRVYN